MATVYDALVGDASQQMVLSAGSQLGYPSSNMYNVFGPIYLPRIYGKDLSSFEIASSGKIAITLQDTFAFDLDRDVGAQVTKLATVAGDSFQIQANSNLVNVTFDAGSNNLGLTASNTIILTAANIEYDISQSSTMNIGGDYTIGAACNVAINAGSNVVIKAAGDVYLASENSNVRIALDHTACNLYEYALHDISLAASNALHLEALTDASLTAVHGSVFLTAADSNVLLTLDSATSNLIAYAQKDISIAASNAVHLEALSNASLTAVHGSVFLTAADSNVLVTLDSASSNLIAYAQKDISIAASNAVHLEALSNASLTAVHGSVFLTAADSNVLVTLDSATSNLIAYAQKDISIAASNAVHLEALSNASLTAVHGSVFLTAADSNVLLTLDSASSNLIAYAQKDISIAASNAVHLEALSNASLTAVHGSVFLTAADSNVLLTLDSASSNLTAYAQKDVRFSASNQLVLAALSNASMTAIQGALLLSAATSNVTLALDDVTLSATLSAKSNVSFTALQGDISAVAQSNVTLAATSASLALAADSSNVTLKLDQPTHSLLGYSLCNASFTAGRDFFVSASNSATLSAKSNVGLSAAAGAATLTLGADSTIQSSAATFAFSAASNAGFTFGVGTSNMMTVQSDKVIVNGGLEVFGVLNSIAVQESELHINDQTVQLSYPNPGETITDGTLNTASGVVVYGMPESAAGSDPTGIYDKSFKWNYGDAGIDAMLTGPGIDTEAYWELKGGRFQMSSTKSDGKKITFALRINESDELEFVKLWDDANDVLQTRRIAKFGRTLM